MLPMWLMWMLKNHLISHNNFFLKPSDRFDKSKLKWFCVAAASNLILVVETAVIDNHMQSLCSSLLTVFLTIKEFLETNQITVYYTTIIFFQGRSTKVFLDWASRGVTTQHPPYTKIGPTVWKLTCGRSTEIMQSQQ